MPKRFVCAHCRTAVAGYDQTPPPSWLVSHQDPEKVLCQDCQEARGLRQLGLPLKEDQPC